MKQFTWIDLILNTKRIVEFKVDEKLVKLGEIVINLFENGKNILYIFDTKHKKLTPLTTSEYNCSSRVHEYGGNSFCVDKNLSCYFANKSDQCLYQIGAELQTPKLYFKTNDCRFTEMTFIQPENKLTEKFDKMISVCEKHDSESKEQCYPKNTICVIISQLNGGNKKYDLVEGADFYADLFIVNNYIVWKQWNHPNMPWDETQIGFGVLSNLSNNSNSLKNIGEELNDYKLSLNQQTIVCSNVGVSYMQPKIILYQQHKPNENNNFETKIKENIESFGCLLYISDASGEGFYNIYKRDMTWKDGKIVFNQQEIGPLVRHASLDDKKCERDIGYPLWVTGDHVYDAIYVPENDTIYIVASTENQIFLVQYCVRDQTSICKAVLSITDASTIAEIHNVTLVHNKNVGQNNGDDKSYFSSNLAMFCLIKPKTAFEYIACIDLETGKIKPVYSIIDEAQSIPHDLEFSQAQEISFNSPYDGRDVFCYLYLPTKSMYGDKPPLIVNSHGGPTAKKYDSLDLKSTQYFTSLGFAVCHVNYRGSFGYGKTYRDALYGKWGILDVHDCCDTALYIANYLGLVNPKNLFVTGSSSGGYTTLACLTFRPEVFSAGVCKYGICDLKALDLETHKFEQFYTQNLVMGKRKLSISNSTQNKDDSMNSFGDMDLEKEYYKRSPIHHVKNIRAPIAFLHGKEDKVVPPEQAITMYNSLIERGILSKLVLFEGEGHGFRDPKNVKAALEAEVEFYHSCITT